jgi:hypothetical protein
MAVVKIPGRGLQVARPLKLADDLRGPRRKLCFRWGTDRHPVGEA